MYSFLTLSNLVLLFGSIGIFLILAITMFFSRKIDWPQADQKSEKVIEHVE